jgi:hypothetical protein
MDRPTLASKMTALVGATKYLEVGIQSGQTFFGVQCAQKFAVDPVFHFDVAEARAAHPHCTFHALTSDAYFAGPALADGPFDVIFLDGLHTSEQIVRDFLNASELLTPRGVILIDDVRPNSYLSGLRSQRMAIEVKAKLGVTDASWMGDVYKIVPFIETFCQQFSYATPLEVSYMLVVWRAPRAPEALGKRPFGQIESIPFEETVINPNFYQMMPLAEICDLITASAAVAR